MQLAEMSLQKSFDLVWQGIVLTHTHAEVTDLILCAVFDHPDENVNSTETIRKAQAMLASLQDLYNALNHIVHQLGKRIQASSKRVNSTTNY